MTKNKVLARNYSKENEAGRDRNSKSSSNLLDKKGGGPASDEQKRIIRRYERLVAPSENSTSGNDDDNDDDDPLEHWLAYIKFYKETFPADVRSQFLLMERCTRALVQRERYRNDVRFIRACILYADKTDFPGDVFKFLHQHRIGSTVALFWIAWAWVAETNGDFGFAEKVFLKGINKDAQPIKMLKTRHKQFQRRMSRHWLKNHTTNTDTQQEDGKNDDNNAAAEVAPNKKTFGSFAGNEAQERNDTFSSLASSRQSQQSEQADGSRQPSGGFQIFEDENRAGQSNRGYNVEVRCVVDPTSVQGGNAGLKEKRPWTATNGFTRRFISTKDSSGVECCYEESRIHANYFSCVSASSNFNLLAHDDSRMEAGEGYDSIEEVEMEEDSMSIQESLSSKHSMQSDGKSTKKVLFAMNVSVDHDNRSIVMNASTASSTVNDRDAVGVPGEETINTKYAMRELSMMFSSPAMGIHDESNVESKSIEKEGVVNESFVKDLVDDDDDCQVNNSIIGNNEDAEPEAPQQFRIFCDDSAEAVSPPPPRKGFQIFNEQPTPAPAVKEPSMRQSEGGFQIFNDGDAEEDEDSPPQKRKHSKAGGFQIYSASDSESETPPKAKKAAPFSIFSEDEPRKSISTRSKSRKSNSSFGGGFQIHKDDDESPAKYSESFSSDSQRDNDSSLPDAPLVPSRPPFAVREDSDSSDSDSYDDDDNVTANTQDTEGTMKLLKEVLADMDPPVRRKSRKSSAFQIREDDLTDDFRKYRPRDSGAIIPIDDDAFGDVSKIDIDISRIQGSPVVASETQVLQFKNAVDYVALHDSDIRQSIRQLSQEACGSTRAGKPFAGRKNNDLALMLSSKGNVVDLPNQSLPKALRKKASAQGEEITVGSRSGVVKQELGRGSYGVVVLLRPVDSGDAIAVKAQAPTDCLAWEYIVMRRLEERLSGIKLGPHPFPKPLSFVSLTDGSLLGMTAGSKNGTNLVDIVNFYNVGEGRPVPELIALHYTSRMLHHIEILHWRGNILHCDVKPDNWVLMGSNEAYDGCIEYVDGADLMLVDFGRAVDLASASPNAKEPLDVMFTGQATSEEMACISMRKNLGWSLDLDTFGICASAHVLLFGEHIEPECRSKKWKAKKTFRRYWQTQLWEEVFSTLLNLDEVSQTAMGSRPRALRQLRNKLEAYLSTKVKDLDSLLKHQCRNLPKRKTSTNKK